MGTLGFTHEAGEGDTPGTIAIVPGDARIAEKWVKRIVHAADTTVARHMEERQATKIRDHNQSANLAGLEKLNRLGFDMSMKPHQGTNARILK